MTLLEKEISGSLEGFQVLMHEIKDLQPEFGNDIQISYLNHNLIIKTQREWLSI